MLNSTRSFYISKHGSFARLDTDIRIDFPSLPQIAGGMGGICHIGNVFIFRIGHPAFSLFTGSVFRTDRARLCIRKPEQITHIATQTIK